jgi:hypothetical protein
MRVAVLIIGLCFLREFTAAQGNVETYMVSKLLYLNSANDWFRRIGSSRNLSWRIRVLSFKCLASSDGTTNQILWPTTWLHCAPIFEVHQDIRNDSLRACGRMSNPCSFSSTQPFNLLHEHKSMLGQFYLKLLAGLSELQKRTWVMGWLTLRQTQLYIHLYEKER